MVRIFDKSCDDILTKIDNRWKDVNQSRGKPVGIWFTQNKQWYEWCKSTHKFKYTAFLELEHDLEFYNILYVDISDENELLSFINKYKKEGSCYNVDWNKVSKEYDGIFIDKVKNIPSSYYQKYNNIDGTWIISLDVDSLCIWKWDENKSHKLYTMIN